MVINSSNISMKGQTSRSESYSKTTSTLATNVLTGEERLSEKSFSMTYENLFSGSYNSKGLLADSDDINITKPSDISETDSLRELLNKLRTFLQDMHEKLLEMLGLKSAKYIDLRSDTSVSSGYNVWNVTKYESYTYEEKASLSFETTGQVITADGRAIDFNLELNMSREYVEQSESLSKHTEVIMTDPIVINLDSNPIGVSNQKWSFDIDGDGSCEKISLLSKGCAFLSFDKNKDGVINDGTELFGARTGNGFAELMAYDSDKNGWIDENDIIFDSLSVWTKNDSGEDRLLSLKEANVGAIYLGSSITNYALKSDVDNSQNAQITRTGMYLTEDGISNTMQQLDMVKALIS